MTRLPMDFSATNVPAQQNSRTTQPLNLTLDLMTEVASLTSSQDDTHTSQQPLSYTIRTLNGFNSLE